MKSGPPRSGSAGHVMGPGALQGFHRTAQAMTGDAADLGALDRPVHRPHRFDHEPAADFGR